MSEVVLFLTNTPFSITFLVVWLIGIFNSYTGETKKNKRLACGFNWLVIDIDRMGEVNFPQSCVSGFLSTTTSLTKWGISCRVIYYTIKILFGKFTRGR